jgi:hypothetical protein
MARAMVEVCEVVMVEQAWRRDMWRWPRVAKLFRSALAGGLDGGSWRG